MDIKSIKWLKELLSEKMDDGTYKLSFTRFTSFVLVTFYIISATYLLFKEHKLIDIPETMAYMIGGIYGINKIGSKLAEKFSSKNKISNTNNVNKTNNTRVD